jgi:hypothetical protein
MIFYFSIFFSAFEVEFLQCLRIYVIENDLAGPWRANSVAVAKQFQPAKDFSLVCLNLEPNFVVANP